MQDFFSHSNYVEVMDGKPIDLLHLSNPPPGMRCDAAMKNGTIVTGHWPDNKVPDGKCSHAQLNKDGPEKPLYYKALKNAQDSHAQARDGIRASGRGARSQARSAT